MVRKLTKCLLVAGATGVIGLTPGSGPDQAQSMPLERIEQLADEPNIDAARRRA